MRIAGAKQRTLLALLLLHANDPVPRDRLIEERWGVKQPQTAATALQVRVSQLRKALGRDLIITRAPAYLIRVADGELDLDASSRRSYAPAPRPPGEAAALRREALARWRGVPFAEIDAPFARAARARLEEQRLRPAGAGAPSPPGSRSWPGAARACRSWLRRGSP